MVASRRRATVSAANMSPVPVKVQSRAGMSILKQRGEPSVRVVEPAMERVGEEEEEEEEEGGGVVKSMDVMMMWGMW